MSPIHSEPNHGTQAIGMYASLRNFCIDLLTAKTKHIPMYVDKFGWWYFEDGTIAPINYTSTTPRFSLTDGTDRVLQTELPTNTQEYEKYFLSHGSQQDRWQAGWISSVKW